MLVVVSILKKAMKNFGSDLDHYPDLAIYKYEEFRVTELKSSHFELLTKQLNREVLEL